MALIYFLTAARNRFILIACAVTIATIYVLVTFDRSFLFGIGPFWANPVGLWLQDPAVTTYNNDVLTLQTGYVAFVHSSWHLPLFFVQNLDAPFGTNIIFMDAVPAVALLGKIASVLTGALVNPYGLWVAACFILSAVFATLWVMEAGQRSLIAAAAASMLVITAPPLLHRFGHLALLGHFVVIGTFYLYLRDRRAQSLWTRSGCWAGWLCLAVLINIYIFAMPVIIYGASLLRRWRVERPSLGAAVKEPAIVVLALAAVVLIAGHLGPGTGTAHYANGFGYFSMNLVSPFWPQRSGLFPGFDSIIDATGGQYEGYNYLGFGALLIAGASVVLNFRELRAKLVEQRELFAALICLLLFAVSHHVFLGNVMLLDLDYSWRIDQLLGIFRSSGRVFWPVFYAIMLFGLVGVLRQLQPTSAVPFVVACCLLQLADTNPLRTRLTTLTQNETPQLLNRFEWQARMAGAAQVVVDPPYQCKDVKINKFADDTMSNKFADGTAQMELQLAAAMAMRPINSVYNARLVVNAQYCQTAAVVARTGPWHDDTLYVFLRGQRNGPSIDWTPARQSCQAFSLGVWCLGQSEKPGDR